MEVLLTLLLTVLGVLASVATCIERKDGKPLLRSITWVGWVIYSLLVGATAAKALMDDAGSRSLSLAQQRLAEGQVRASESQRRLEGSQTKFLALQETTSKEIDGLRDALRQKESLAVDARTRSEIAQRELTHLQAETADRVEGLRQKLESKEREARGRIETAQSALAGLQRSSASRLDRLRAEAQSAQRELASSQDRLRRAKEATTLLLALENQVAVSIARLRKDARLIRRRAADVRNPSQAGLGGVGSRRVGTSDDPVVALRPYGNRLAELWGSTVSQLADRIALGEHPSLRSRLYYLSTNPDRRDPVEAVGRGDVGGGGHGARGSRSTGLTNRQQWLESFDLACEEAVEILEGALRNRKEKAYAELESLLSMD